MATRKKTKRLRRNPSKVSNQFPQLPKKKKVVPSQGELFKSSIPDPKTVTEPKRPKVIESAEEAIREQRIREKRRNQWKAATKNFRIRKEDKGEVVFLRAYDIPVKGRPAKGVKTITKNGKKYYPAGERLPKGTKQSVFIVKVGKTGKIEPYYDWKEKGGTTYQVQQKNQVTGKAEKAVYAVEKKLDPAPKKIRSADLRVFKSKSVNKKFYGETMGTSTPTTIKGINMDFVDRVVPKVANVLKNEADRNKSGRSFVIQCSAQVATDDGIKRTANFDVDFKQADKQQFQQLGFYEPWVARKLYAEMAEQLKDLGLVTQGSAQYIEALPINEGEDDPAKWKDSKGMPWKQGKGHLLKMVKLVRFDVIPRLVMIRSGIK